MQMAANRALISFTILLVLGQTMSSGLDCENVDAAACKQRFGKQLDQQIKDATVESLKQEFILIKNFNTELLKVLSKNNPSTETLQRQTQLINGLLPKLNKDTTGETMVNIIIPLKDTPVTYYDDISFDGELNGDYKDSLFQRSLAEFNSAGKELSTQTREKLLDIWRELYAQLRSVDHAAYSEYAKINNALNESKSNGIYHSSAAIVVFLDVPYMKNITEIMFA